MRFKPDCTEDSPYVTDEGGSQYHSTRTACCLQYTVQVFLPAAQRSACWRETSPRPRLSPPLWERLLCDFTAFITLTVSSRGTYSSVSTCSTCSTCSITHRCWGVSVVDRFELHGPTSDDLTTQTQRLLIRGIDRGSPSWPCYWSGESAIRPVVGFHTVTWSQVFHRQQEISPIRAHAHEASMWRW